MEKRSTFMLSILMLLAICSIAMANSCNSNSPVTSKLYMLNKEIKKQDLGNFTVTENFQIKIDFYNKCGLKITNINFSTDELEITFEPNFKAREMNTYSHKEFLQNNETIIINLNATLVGKYKLSGKYFPLETYYITFIPGEPSEKSILEVDKTIINAGEIVTAYIIPYDKYDNLIDANIYKTNNSFNVSYNKIKSNSYFYVKDYKIINIINYPLISYNINLTIAGEISINGRIGNISLNNRVITVNHIEIDFNLSKLYKYEEGNNEELIENGTVIKTDGINQKFRLYLKDKYENAVEFPEEKLKNLNSYLTFSKQKNLFYYFKLNNQKYNEQQYAEFVIDNDKIAYKNLVYGNYEFVFNEGSENLLYEIVLDNGCSSEKPFKCLFGNIQCGASQTDCECPTGYIKCDYMHYCVLGNRSDMCFTRDSELPTPNQRICPIGKVLCADLSCKDNYNECKVSSKCLINGDRCPDQSCRLDVNYCPKIKTCKKTTNYICNNRDCVESEFECE